MMKDKRTTLAATLLLALGLTFESLLPRVAVSQAAAPPETVAAPRIEEAARNRLARESSPYLLQHADNPVDWYPWGEEALARAQSENKLIFLSVGYSTCYWCHVMERQVFSDTVTAEIMNKHFINVLVDREERQDIDAIYMRYRVLRGDSGGWPLSALLTPDLKPVFAGGTLFNPQFSALLEQARRGWSQQQDRLQAYADEATEAIERSTRLLGEGASYGLPSRNLLRTAADAFAKVYDPTHGGFGRGTKFPQPAILEMLMSLSEGPGQADALRMAVGTLEAMARGGIHDHLGGGFHRYATDRAWQVPHFEKMLYDNAQLLHAYARAYGLTGRKDFRRVVEASVVYLDRDMTDPSGLFYAAEDSETEEIEGAYYLWKDDEIESLLTEDSHELFLAAYGLAAVPDGAHGGALYRRADSARIASKAGLSAEALEDRLVELRQELLAAREGRERPFRDEKIIAGWNGLMIEALAYAGRRLDRDDYVWRAERAAGALLETLVDGDGSLLHLPVKGETRIAAYLNDYGPVILGLSELYQATGNAHWLNAAARLAEAMIDRLYDGLGGGFSDVAADLDDLIAVPKTARDGALPAGNSLAARALYRLGALGLRDFDTQARHVFSSFAPTLERSPDTLPYMLWALNDLYRHDAALEASRSRPRQTSEVVRLAARLMDSPAGPAQRQRLVATLHIDEGWHVNANPTSFDFLIPTTLGFEVDGRELAIAAGYPESHILDTPIGPLSVYEDASEIRADLPAKLTAAEKPESVDLKLIVQACNETGTCLPPETLTLSLAL